MIITDQNSATESLNLNLNHPINLVDGRSREDQLNFISEFAKLINFYDKDNKLNGNWAPFLLKDPLFLGIRMSMAKAAYHTKLFSDACISLDELINESQVQNYPQTFNNLFDKLLTVFWKVQDWTKSMQLVPVEYDLRTYTLNAVQDTFSNYLWAILGLRHYLSTTAYVNGITPPEIGLYEGFDLLIWKTNKDKRPFWEVLGQESIDSFNSPRAIFDIMQENGNYIYSFFGSLSEMAKQDLEEIGEMTTDFPDTLLLRTFVDLLETSKVELNSLTAKHLDFYYAEILKQQAKLAKPDSAFVSLVLAKIQATYMLEKGTLFSAGLDANKNPILFEILENQSINPALLNAVYTLTPGQNEVGKPVLFLDENAAPSTVVKDDMGSIQSWDTFGASNQNKDKEKQMGVAFASPMLLMNSGTRQLTVTIEFSQTDLDMTVLKDAATFYLSTASSWLDITATIQENSNTPNANQWEIDFLLTTKEPPIVPYLKCPDGYQSKWPVLKIMFSSFANLKSPPNMLSITFNTVVTGMSDFVLSNDNGALNPAKPFQLFGPIANAGSSFYIGNKEVFSKKLDSFTLGITWDGLPPNFTTYYDTYNQYLENKLVVIPVESPAGSGKSDDKGGGGSIVGDLVSDLLPKWLRFGEKIGADIVDEVISKREAEKTAVITDSPTDPPNPLLLVDSNFKVDFDLLNDDKWSAVSLTRMSDCAIAEQLVTCTVPIVPDDTSTMNNLFNMEQTDNTLLAPTTFYQFKLNTDKTNALSYDPLIQQETSTALSINTKAGFIRMTLEAPSNGFGNTIYPQVVSMVALVNADALMNTKKGDTPVLIAIPSSPFIPTVKSFKGDYSATETYAFDFMYATDETDQTNKIIECYHYSVFENYLVYNTQKPTDSYEDNIGLEILGALRSMSGINLYPKLTYDGVLYFKLTQVLVANQVSFYFELNETEFRSADQPYELEYFYLSKTGWKSLNIMTDSTQNLTCSGTIVFYLPVEMSETHIQMPNAFFWCAAGLRGKWDDVLKNYPKVNPNGVAKTAFLQTNGAKLTRTGTNYLEDTSKPVLSPAIIKSPASPIPEISTAAQPFASFGGRAAENKNERNLRVANLMKTKGKAITENDYKRLIAENFDEVFYSKLYFDRTSRAIEIYLVKGVDSPNDKNAFLPLVSTCLENQVTDFLNQNSGYGQLAVQNFKVQYLVVNATVYISSAYGLKSTAQRITQALKVFLSPWIKSDTPQIPIDQGITDVQVIDFIDGFSEVSSVGDVTFNLSVYDKNSLKDITQNVTTYYPSESVLIVPDLNQLVKCKLAV